MLIEIENDSFGMEVEDGGDSCIFTPYTCDEN